jgi:hypothetical protein
MSELQDQELKSFEAELRKVQVAPAPDALISRLLAVRPRPQPTVVDRIHSEPQAYAWTRLLRWLAPATALGALLLVTFGRHPSPPAGPSGTNSQQPQSASASLASAVQPGNRDEIEIGRTLVATFDAVAEMPSGEPVRFRCQEWADTTVFRDRARGIAIERSTPRLEIVPISFETY